MLNFFSDGELPGGVEGPFASRDVTSFYELWQAASKIEAVCLLHAGKPGWAAEGMWNWVFLGVGIFFGNGTGDTFWSRDCAAEPRFSPPFSFSSV